MAQIDEKGEIGPKELAAILRCSERHARRWLSFMHERHPSVVDASNGLMRRRRYRIKNWRRFLEAMKGECRVESLGT